MTNGQTRLSSYSLSLDKVSDEIGDRLWKFFMKMFKEDKTYKQIVSSQTDLKKGVVIISYEGKEKYGEVKSMIDYNYYSALTGNKEDLIVLDKDGLKKFVQSWLRENVPPEKINDDEFVQGQVSNLLKNLGYEDEKGVKKIMKMVPKKIDDAYAEMAEAKPGKAGIEFGTAGLGITIGYGPLTTQTAVGISPWMFNYAYVGISLIPDVGVLGGVSYFPPIGAIVPKVSLSIPFGHLQYDLIQKQISGSWATFSSLGINFGILYFQNVMLGQGSRLWERMWYALKETQLQMLDPFITAGRYLHHGTLGILSLFGQKYSYENIGEMESVMDTAKKIVSNPDTTVVAMRHPSLYLPMFKNAVHANEGYLSGVGMAMLDDLKLFDAQGEYKIFAWPPFQNKVKYERKQIRKRIEKAMEFNEKLIGKIKAGEKLSNDELNQFRINLTYLSMKLAGQSDCPYEYDNVIKNVEKSWSALSFYFKNNNPKYDNNISMYNDGLFFDFMGRLLNDKDAIKTGHQLTMYGLFKETEHEGFDPAIELFKNYSNTAVLCGFDHDCISNMFKPTKYWNSGISQENFRRMVENNIAKNIKKLPIDDWVGRLINNSTKTGFDNEGKAYENFVYLKTVKMMQGEKIDKETGEVLALYEDYITTVGQKQYIIQGGFYDTGYVKGILNNLSDLSRDEKIENLGALVEAINKTVTEVEDILKKLDDMKPETKKGNRFIEKLQKKYKTMLNDLEKNRNMVDKELKKVQETI